MTQDPFDTPEADRVEQQTPADPGQEDDTDLSDGDLSHGDLSDADLPDATRRTEADEADLLDQARALFPDEDGYPPEDR